MKLCLCRLYRLSGNWGVGRQHLHLDAGPGASVQAALDGVCQSSVLDGVKGDAVARVCDGMHLLDEGQGREGCVTVHHLIQDAAQAPYVGCPANL